MFTDRLSRLVYHFIARLLFSLLAGDCVEQHTPTEDSYTAGIGPLRLSLNECFVLDHADAGIDFCLPTRQRMTVLGLRVCIGTEQIRQPGLYFNHAPV